MASQDSALRTAQVARDYTRNSNPDMRPYQQTLRYAKFNITLDTAVASNDDIVLGSLGVAGYVVPEQSTIVGISGSAAGSFTLEKVNTAGTVAAITGAAAISTDGTPVAFARHSDKVLKSFDATDYLQVTFTEASANAVVATDVLEILVAYISEELQ